MSTCERSRVEANSTKLEKNEPYLPPSPKEMKRCPDASKGAALTVGESEKEAKSSATAGKSSSVAE
jgi:hypothetical protein